MKCDNVNFTSRINFVNEKTYSALRKGVDIDFRVFDKSAQKSDEFYSDAVRTCTAGGLVDTKGFEALGFHYCDSEENFGLIDKFIDKMFSMVKNPDRAVLFGGKWLNSAPYSIKNFQKIKDVFLQRVNHVTIFEEHFFPWSETDFHYCLKDDRWDLHTMFRSLDFKEKSVLSMYDLKRNFKNIQIAQGDTVTFE